MLEAKTKRKTLIGNTTQQHNNTTQHNTTRHDTTRHHTTRHDNYSAGGRARPQRRRATGPPMCTLNAKIHTKLLLPFLAAAAVLGPPSRPTHQSLATHIHTQTHTHTHTNTHTNTHAHAHKTTNTSYTQAHQHTGAHTHEHTHTRTHTRAHTRTPWTVGGCIGKRWLWYPWGSCAGLSSDLQVREAKIWPDMALNPKP